MAEQTTATQAYGQELGAQWARAWIGRSAEVVEQHRTELIDLDRAIGDGDHGENLSRGFAAATAALAEAEAEAPAAVFKTVALTLMSTVGGAAGPLYGAVFLGAAKATAVTPLDAEGVASAIGGALDALTRRGKATTGEKTMVDAWSPAAAAARRAAAEGAPPGAVLRAAAEAAARGASQTEPLVATKGRASYLGERAIGHRDPGAQSTALILAAGAEVAESLAAEQ